MEYICVAIDYAYMPEDTDENAAAGGGTNIRVSIETWRRLKNRKDRPNKSFDEVIQELLEESDPAEKRGTAEKITGDGTAQEAD